jgi:hypothetical protein
MTLSIYDSQDLMKSAFYKQLENSSYDQPQLIFIEDLQAVQFLDIKTTSKQN